MSKSLEDNMALDQDVMKVTINNIIEDLLNEAQVQIDQLSKTTAAELALVENDDDVSDEIKSGLEEIINYLGDASANIDDCCDNLRAAIPG